MFKKKEKTEKAPKNKKVRTMKVGTHKKSVLLLWAVLLASTSFGVYKNFTAIDTHTVHEKEIIQLRLNDTNGIENFVKNFAKAYYSWDTSKEAIDYSVPLRFTIWQSAWRRFIEAKEERTFMVYNSGLVFGSGD